jgi:hypothetical protein
MHRIAATLALILLLAACGDILASPTEPPSVPMPDGPWEPLSRLTVHNQDPGAVYLRANWVDGMEQTSAIPVGNPLYISGSIAGAFPAIIEILGADCSVIRRLTGQPWRTQAMITVSDTGLAFDPITTSERAWPIAEVVDDCRTEPDLP